MNTRLPPITVNNDTPPKPLMTLPRDVHFASQPLLKSQMPIGPITPLPSDDPDWRHKKRKRVPKSCIPCYEGRKGCDRGTPCNNCFKKKQTGACIYRTLDSPTTSSATTSTAIELQQQATRTDALHLEIEALRSLLVYHTGPLSLGMTSNLPLGTPSGQGNTPQPQAVTSNTYNDVKLDPTPALEELPPPLESLTFPSDSQPAPKVTFKGQVFGLSKNPSPGQASPAPSTELFVHGACAPALINHINWLNKDSETQVINLNYVFDQSNYSERQEAFLRHASLSQRRDHPDPIARVLELRPDLEEMEDLWRIFEECIESVFHASSSSGHLKHQFMSFVTLNPTENPPSNVDAARFAAMMSLCMLFCSKEQQRNWSMSDKLVPLQFMSIYKDACPRHVSCRAYVALAISILESMPNCTLDIVHVELLCVISLWNLGAHVATKGRFAQMLSRSCSMGLNTHPSSLLSDAFLKKDHGVREKLAWQIQHIDFIISSSIGSQPVTFDLFVGKTEIPREMPLSCRYTLEAIRWAKQIYGRCFPPGGSQMGEPSYQEAAQLTEEVLAWRKKHDPIYLPQAKAIVSSPQANSDAWLYKSFHLPANQPATHAAVSLTMLTANLILILQRPFIQDNPEALLKCLGASHICVSTVYSIRSQSPDTSILRTREKWSWITHACIVLAYGATVKQSGVDRGRVMADLVLASQMVEPATPLSSVKNFEKVIKNLTSFSASRAIGGAWETDNK